MIVSAAPTRTRILFALVVVSILASSLFQRYLGHVLASPNLDFYDYYFAGQIVHDHRKADLYSGATEDGPQPRSAPVDSELFQRARAAGFHDIELYLYPPLLADLLAPTAKISPQRVAQLWRLLNLCCVFGMAVLLAWLLAVPLFSAQFVVIAVLAAACWPVHETIALGQVSIVMALLWTIAIVAYAEDAVVISALALALATALKVTPLLAVPVFAIWKDRKWLVTYAAGLAGLIAVMATINGTGSLVQYFHVIRAMGHGSPAVQNKSIEALLEWLYYGKLFSLGLNQKVPSNPPHLLAIAGKALAAALYGVAVALVWRLRGERAWLSRASTLSVFALLACVIAPISWRHGYVAALPLFAILWRDELATSGNKPRLALLTLASIAVGSLVFDLAARTPIPEFLKIACAAVWMLSCAALCVEVLANGGPLKILPDALVPGNTEVLATGCTRTV